MSGAPKDRTDLYDILGVPPTATQQEIESAYRRLARQWHPDVSTEPIAATENFKAIARAYEVLSDPEQRRRYDRDAPRRRRARRKSHFGPGGGDLEPDEDLDVEAELLLTSEEAAWGGWIEFSLSFPEPCPACDGQGQLGPQTCWACAGRGLVPGPKRLVQFELAPGLPQGTVLCLRGRGRPAEKPQAPGDLYLRVRIRPDPVG
jgi:DnaJ-class molecular chaperone